MTGSTPGQGCYRNGQPATVTLPGKPARGSTPADPDQIMDMLQRGKPVASSDDLVVDTWLGDVDDVRIYLNVAVREWEDNIAFLHKIVDGAADKSYGIHVARLAGVPPEVNERAKHVLAELEAEHLDEEGRPRIAGRASPPTLGRGSSRASS
jgi:hypothetical protein